MVKDINVACDNYQKGIVEQEQLDSSIEENLEIYLQSPDKKEVYYLE